MLLVVRSRIAEREWTWKRIRSGKNTRKIVGQSRLSSVSGEDMADFKQQSEAWYSTSQSEAVAASSRSTRRSIEFNALQAGFVYRSEDA